MGMKCCNQNCKQGRECPHKEDRFATWVTVILAVMVVLLIVRTVYE